MMRILLFALLIASLLLFSACSYTYDYVVVNKSNELIEVQYKLTRRAPENLGKFVDIRLPAKASVTEFEKSKPEWRDLQKEEYSFDNSTGTFTVKVAPDEALLVDSFSDAAGDEGRFGIASITINGSKGSINLQGRQAQTQFKPESDTKYVIRYR
jgi:hypothetical protein